MFERFCFFKLYSQLFLINETPSKAEITQWFPLNNYFQTGAELYISTEVLISFLLFHWKNRTWYLHHQCFLNDSLFQIVQHLSDCFIGLWNGIKLYFIFDFLVNAFPFHDSKHMICLHVRPSSLHPEMAYMPELYAVCHWISCMPSRFAYYQFRMGSLSLVVKVNWMSPVFFISEVIQFW